MVAKLDGPQFSGGVNIAIKCPSHTYEQTVAFYRDTLGLPLIEEEKDGCIFQFGPNRLWIDNVPNLSHPDIWLELETNDPEAASSFLKVHGVTRRDEIEQLTEDFNGFSLRRQTASFTSSSARRNRNLGSALRRVAWDAGCRLGKMRAASPSSDPRAPAVEPQRL
jgi:hypothetical protein